MPTSRVNVEFRGRGSGPDDLARFLSPEFRNRGGGEIRREEVPEGSQITLRARVNGQTLYVSRVLRYEVLEELGNVGLAAIISSLENQLMRDSMNTHVRGDEPDSRAREDAASCRGIRERDAHLWETTTLACRRCGITLEALQMSIASLGISAIEASASMRALTDAFSAEMDRRFIYGDGRGDGEWVQDSVYDAVPTTTVHDSIIFETTGGGGRGGSGTQCFQEGCDEERMVGHTRCGFHDTIEQDRVARERAQRNREASAGWWSRNARARDEARRAALSPEPEPNPDRALLEALRLASSG